MGLITEYRDPQKPNNVLWTDGRRNMPEIGTILNAFEQGWEVVAIEQGDDSPTIIWVKPHAPRKGITL